MEVKIKPLPLLHTAALGREASSSFVLLINKIIQAVPAVAKIMLVCHTSEGFISSDKLADAPDTIIRTLL